MQNVNFSNLHPHDQKEFWKVVKSLNTKQSIIPTLRHCDIIASSNLEKANLLNASLVKNYNHSLPGLMLSDLPHTSPDNFPTDFVCTEEVYGLLSTLDRPPNMMTIQPECSRRLHSVSLQL